MSVCVFKSSTYVFSINRGYTLKTALIASCNTIRQSRTHHFEPGRMAVTNLQRFCHTSFEECPSLMLKVAIKYSKNSRWEAGVHCPSPHHLELHCPKRSCKIHHQCYDSSTGSTRLVPSHSTAFLPFLNHWSSQPWLALARSRVSPPSARKPRFTTRVHAEFGRRFGMKSICSNSCARLASACGHREFLCLHLWNLTSLWSLGSRSSMSYTLQLFDCLPGTPTHSHTSSPLPFHVDPSVFAWTRLLLELE